MTFEGPRFPSVADVLVLQPELDAADLRYRPAKAEAQNTVSTRASISPAVMVGFAARLACNSAILMPTATPLERCGDECPEDDQPRGQDTGCSDLAQRVLRLRDIQVCVVAGRPAPF